MQAKQKDFYYIPASFIFSSVLNTLGNMHFNFFLELPLKKATQY